MEAKQREMAVVQGDGSGDGDSGVRGTKAGVDTGAGRDGSEAWGQVRPESDGQGDGGVPKLMFPGLRESMDRRRRLEWEEKGVGFGGRAIAIVKKLGGSLEDAELLQFALLDAFEAGVKWEYARHLKDQREKAAIVKRRLARLAKKAGS